MGLNPIGAMFFKILVRCGLYGRMRMGFVGRGECERQDKKWE
jgi:hypothetical protein